MSADVDLNYTRKTCQQVFLAINVNMYVEAGRDACLLCFYIVLGKNFLINL